MRQPGAQRPSAEHAASDVYLGAEGALDAAVEAVLDAAAAVAALDAAAAAGWRPSRAMRSSMYGRSLAPLRELGKYSSTIEAVPSLPSQWYSLIITAMRSVRETRLKFVSGKS